MSIMMVPTSRTRTASTSTMETARGTHAFKVERYSLHRGLGVGNFVRSSTFGVGGYDWCISLHPDGWESSEGQAWVYLELMSTGVAEVMVSFDFRLVDQATGQSTGLNKQNPIPRVFTSSTSDASAWGVVVAHVKELDAPSSTSTFLRGDCLVIECDVTVLTGKPRVTAAAAVRVPPSDLSENLRWLLEEKQGADVTFKVADEVFPAHKIVLAMRSPVFRAEFFGPMVHSTTAGQCSVITIEDMHPDAFRALLHFVYTDTMPSEMEQIDKDDAGSERKEMVTHLLVAADRYAMERLKLMCEAVLCESIGVENVAAMAALADRHGCEGLGHACAEFIASSTNERVREVVASPGYVQLKKACPAVLVDMFERVANLLCA